MQNNTIWKIPDEYICRSLYDNICFIRKNLQGTYLETSNMEDNAFLFNLRSINEDYNLGILSHAIIDEKNIYLYIDNNKLELDAKKYLKDNDVVLKNYFDFDNDIQYYKNKTQTNFSIKDYKSIKNEKEIQLMTKIYKQDEKILDDFIDFVKNINFSSSHIKWTERLLMEELDNRRKKEDNFISLSFKTIMAYRESAATIHYDTPCNGSIDTSKIIKNEGYLLIDSGAHYLGGTTDFTKTFPLGDVSAIEREHYNLVLEAHKRLKNYEFEEGTKGYELDAISRNVFLDQGLDFNHGTGHGVGYMLCVHENPPTITKKRATATDLWGDAVIKENQIMSIEPGLYFENKYGIRIEHLYRVVKNEKGLLKFKCLNE